MILGFLFFIQNVLKHCKALSTEKYRRYINIYYYYYYYYYYYTDKRVIERQQLHLYPSWQVASQLD